MSSLLKEAIIDASALKEAALKNAEATIIEKYSGEVKNTIKKLLEQDELDSMFGDEMDAEMGEEMGMNDTEDPTIDPQLEETIEEVTDESIPLAAADGLSEEVGIGAEETLGEDEIMEFNVNLDALQEAIKELRSELEEEEIEINEEDLISMLEQEDLTDILEEEDKVIEEATPEEIANINRHYDREKAKDTVPGTGAFKSMNAPSTQSVDDEPPATKAPHQASPQGATVDQVRGKWDNLDEEITEESEEMIDAIMEELIADMGADLSGWAGRSSEEKDYQIEKELARRRSTDETQDLKDLKDAQEELVFENNQIKGQIEKYKQTIEQLKEALQDINLSNARLLYTNRALKNASLNERQKSKIAEAISKADTVIEAKTIYNTLQSTMEVNSAKRRPQSLSEAIGRSPTTLRATRKESKPVDLLSDRMKKLAGIK
tara:strand:+ start:3184 stop:4485 length:1302 start_codon:yes stop_codon:yes gene_type:complete